MKYVQIISNYWIPILSVSKKYDNHREQNKSGILGESPGKGFWNGQVLNPASSHQVMADATCQDMPRYAKTPCSCSQLPPSPSFRPAKTASNVELQELTISLDVFYCHRIFRYLKLPVDPSSSFPEIYQWLGATAATHSTSHGTPQQRLEIGALSVRRPFQAHVLCQRFRSPSYHWNHQAVR